jgi:hypothetical protein
MIKDSLSKTEKGVCNVSKCNAGEIIWLFFSKNYMIVNLCLYGQMDITNNDTC